MQEARYYPFYSHYVTISMHHCIQLKNDHRHRSYSKMIACKTGSQIYFYFYFWLSSFLLNNWFPYSYESSFNIGEYLKYILILNYKNLFILFERSQTATSFCGIEEKVLRSMVGHHFEENVLVYLKILARVWCLGWKRVGRNFSHFCHPRVLRAAVTIAAIAVSSCTSLLLLLLFLLLLSHLFRPITPLRKPEPLY